MGWSHLATQFCLELAFGVLLALAFVPRAPVGAFFYRLMGTTALVPLLAAAVMLLTGGEARPRAGIAAALAVCAYPLYSGPFRVGRSSVGLALGLLGCGAALVFLAQDARVLDAGAGLGLRTLVSASVLATGAVAGGVGLAMVLGHWYLTVPKLAVAHLARLNRVTVGMMLASAACLVSSCVLFAEQLSTARTPLFSPFGLFYLGTRTVVGLALPLLFAGMVAQSLQHQNTRSATGILYASTVLVLIGTAASIALQDGYGVPL
jgi:hypothetical protein